MTDPKTYTAGMMIETNTKKGPGTIGGFGRDASGHPVLISCSHVLFPGFKALSNTRVYSPGYSSTCCGGDPIARPVFDATKQASDEGPVEGWVGGYHAGLWTGGFNWIPAKVNVNGHNVNGHASEIDCAAARLDPGVRFSNAWQINLSGTVNTIPLKGVVTDSLGIGKGPKLGTAPTDQQYVRLYSAEHETLQYGTMLSLPILGEEVAQVGDPDNLIYRSGIGDLTDARAGTKANVNQLLILPRPAPVTGQPYQDGYRNGEILDIDEGESGSFVINSDNLIIAMLIRQVDPTQVFTTDMSALELRNVVHLGLATPIERVLANLNVTIPADPDGWSGTVPASGPRAARVIDVGLEAQTARRRQAVAQLRGELHTSVRGRLLLGKIGQHRHEVRRLMTTVRPIAATWRALAGPAYLAACLRSLEDPGHRIPAIINGVPRERLLAAMAALFGKYGSDPLRRDIERYEGLLAGALLPLSALGEVPAALARPGVRS